MLAAASSFLAGRPGFGMTRGCFPADYHYQFPVSGFQFRLLRNSLNTFVPRCARPSHCRRAPAKLRSTSTIASNNYLASWLRHARRGLQANRSRGRLCDTRGGFRGWRAQIMHMVTTTVYGSPHPRVRVLVADDHEVMRLGIRNLLEVQPGWSVCAEANNGQEALEKDAAVSSGRDHHGHQHAGDERP